MRKLYVLSIVLLGIPLSAVQPQSASGWEVCPPSNLSCTAVDDHVEICPDGAGARVCTVYKCSNGVSYTCCTECEGPN